MRVAGRGADTAARNPHPASLGRRLVVGIVAGRRTIIVGRHRPHVGRRLELWCSATAAWWPASAVCAPKRSAAFSVLAAVRRSAAVAATTFVNARPATQHFLPTCSEHSLQRFDAVIGGFEEEILHHRLGAL